MGTMRRKRVVMLGLSALLLAGLGQRPAVAGVSEVNGSAYGAYAKVSLFGGPPNQVGAAPVAVLPTTGGSETESLPKLIAQFGPATIFGGRFVDPGRNPSGELRATTKGETGADGFVTSSASVIDIGPGPLIADEMRSTCTADGDGVSGSATISKGVLETKYDASTQESTVTAPVPEKPAPNTLMEGTVDHVGDRFRVVFNEQVINGDTIIVRAAHMYLLGPVAVGDLVVGQSVCGLSAGDASTAPPTTAPDATGTSTTEPATADPSNRDAAAASTDAGSAGGSARLYAALAAVGGLGLLALIAVKRRRRSNG